MAEIINLNKARKAKTRADKKIQAAENRAKFGRSGADRKRDEARAAKAERDLAGHRLSDDGPE